MEKVKILGVKIDAIQMVDVVSQIRVTALAHQRTLMTHVNIHGLNLAYENPWFSRFLNRADIVFCDGMGVLFGARLLGYHLPERFTLADWVWPLVEMGAINSLRFYLLGNPPGMAERAAQVIQKRFPDFIIAGSQHGYFNKTPGHTENEAVIEQINAAAPDVLMVGFGMPVQEQWLQDNWHRLDATVTMTCGAIFEYIAGDLPRGPAWMTQNYLEWLARVVISPRRYARRYARDIPLFIYRVLKQRIGL